MVSLRYSDCYHSHTLGWDRANHVADVFPPQDRDPSPPARQRVLRYGVVVVGTCSMSVPVLQGGSQLVFLAVEKPVFLKKEDVAGFGTLENEREVPC